MHSKIVTSVLADFIFVEFDGESPRSKFEQNRVEQTAENGRKMSGDEHTIIHNQKKRLIKGGQWSHQV